MCIGKSRMGTSGASNAPPFISHFHGKFFEIYSFCYYKTEKKNRKLFNPYTIAGPIYQDTLKNMNFIQKLSFLVM